MIMPVACRMSFIASELCLLTLVTSKLSCSAFFKAVFFCSTRVLKLMPLTRLKDPVPHYCYSVSHLVASLQEPYSCCFPSSSPQPSGEIHAKYTEHHTSKEGLQSEKFRSKKLFSDNGLFYPIKTCHGRPVVCGPEPLPTRGHVMCRKSQI